MATIFDMLGGSLGNEDFYQAQNPWYRTGQGLLTSLANGTGPTPTTNTEAIFGPALQGLLAGAAMRQGRNSAEEEAKKAYTDSPIFQLLKGSQIQGNVGPVASGEEYGKALTEADPFLMYKTGALPEGWTADKGKQDLGLATLILNSQQEAQQKAQEIRDKLNAEYGPEAVALKAKLAGEEAAAKKAAEIAAERDAYGGGLDPKTARDLEDKTYKRVTDLPSFKQFSDIEANFKTLLAVKDNEEASAAPAMITSFAKIMDPTSTVREGEYNTISKSVQGWLDQKAGDWKNAFLGKTKLSKKAREQMAIVASKKFNEFGSKYDTEKGALVGALEKSGGDPSNVPLPGFAPYVPPGMKLQRNKLTGETRIVPQ